MLDHYCSHLKDTTEISPTLTEYQEMEGENAAKRPRLEQLN